MAFWTGADARSKGKPHYFVGDVGTARGLAVVDRRCSACGKPREHSWHLQKPRRART